MLFLTMGTKDYVMLNGSIKTTVERVSGKGRVAVSVEAPRDVPILRGAVYEGDLAAQGALGQDPARAAAKPDALAAKPDTAQKPRRPWAGPGFCGKGGGPC
jgi:sRNA-binding carbon storage regulator CsrA